MTTLGRLLPGIVVLVGLLYLVKIAVIAEARPGAMRIEDFGRLPVVYQGRLKPFDTLARNSLLILSGRQSFRDQNGKKQPAIRWLLDVMAKPEAALDHAVFRVENLDVLATLGVDAREGFRYAPREFAARAQRVDLDSNRARQRDPAERDVYDNKILEFAEKAHLYRLFAEANSIPALGPSSSREDFALAIERFTQMRRFNLPHAVPPPPSTPTGEWKPFYRAAVEAMVERDPNVATLSLRKIFEAYARGDVKGFNREVLSYRTYLDRFFGPEVGKLEFEVFYNHFSPFWTCFILYVLAFVLGCFSWLGWTTPLRRSAFWLTVLTAGVHTLAIIARIYLSTYPPVTNLYSSALFIGWGSVLLGLFLECLYRMGIGNLISAVSGALTLVIAHFLAGDGDTLQMMQAVLDTRFWLATHVVTVTLGYTATYVAGGLAVLFILRSVFTRSVDAGVESAMGRMIYGVVCFALLLSFVGTVLGGLWADDSWGRFWGWDPKENGALIIVLWNALILHARWGGMVRTRGLAVLAVFGNIVTSWSWFGVNQLGVGLHSYGFMESTAFWILVFVISQLAIMVIGMLPKRPRHSGENSS